MKKTIQVIASRRAASGSRLLRPSVVALGAALSWGVVAPVFAASPFLGAPDVTARPPGGSGSALARVMEAQSGAPAAQTAPAPQPAVQVPAAPASLTPAAVAVASPAMIEAPAPLLLRASWERPSYRLADWTALAPSQSYGAALWRPAMLSTLSFSTLNLPAPRTSFADAPVAYSVRNFASLGLSYRYAPAREAAPQAVPAPAPVPAPRAYKAVRRTDRPDVFGSTAIAVSGTALDARWRKAFKVGGSAAPAASAGFMKASLSEAQPVRLSEINRWVNHAIAFEDDQRLYGERDHWASAQESLSLGRGDCEDYAIAKMTLLKAAGFAPSDLFLVVVKDTVRRQDHAVLVVRQDGRFLTLDSATDRVLSEDEVEDYRPVITYSAAGGVWVHGAPQRSAPVTIASNEYPSPAAR